MTDDQAIGLLANIPRVLAMRKRHELELRPDLKLSVDGMKQLVLAETGSMEAAEEAASAYAYQLVRNEECRASD